MILEEMLDQVIAPESLHDVIEDVREQTLFGTADPANRDYAHGKHAGITDPTRATLLGDMKTGRIKENLISICLEQIAARVRFRRFTVTDSTTQEWMNEFSTKNQFERAMTSTIKRVLTDGSAAMSVSWKRGALPGKGRIILKHEAWWDGNTGVFLSLDDTGQVEWAVSEFVHRDKSRRRTVYFDDIVIKYMQHDKGWIELETIQWRRTNGAPLGIPFAHFSNGASPYGPYGQSTVGEVVGVQDGLNASLVNRQIAAAFTGAQVYYATGVTNSDLLEVGPGKFWAVPNPAAKVGAISAGDLGPLLEDSDDLRGIIAGAFPVPAYRLGRGDWPSGLALQRADSPMIARCTGLITVNKPGAIHLVHRGTEQFNHFSTEGGLNEDAIVDAEFWPPDDLDPGTKAEIDQSLADLYASLDDLSETLVKKLSVLDEDELKAYLREREAAKAEEQAQFEQQMAQAPDRAATEGW